MSVTTRLAATAAVAAAVVIILLTKKKRGKNVVSRRKHRQTELSGHQRIGKGTGELQSGNKVRASRSARNSRLKKRMYSSSRKSKETNKLKSVTTRAKPLSKDSSVIQEYKDDIEAVKVEPGPTFDYSQEVPIEDPDGFQETGFLSSEDLAYMKHENDPLSAIHPIWKSENMDAESSDLRAVKLEPEDYDLLTT